MNYQLSKREKRLLYILLCVIIVLGGWFFLVEPALNEHTTATSELSQKQMELVTIENEYQSYQDASDGLEEESSKYNALANTFFGMMNSEDVDKLLTELALRHYVTPTSLRIGEMQECTIASYLGTSEETTSDSEGAGLLYEVSVEMSVTGDFANIFAMCDEIREQTTYRVTAMDYATDTNSETSTMNLNFSVYMLNK